MINTRLKSQKDNSNANLEKNERNALLKSNIEISDSQICFSSEKEELNDENEAEKTKILDLNFNTQNLLTEKQQEIFKLNQNYEFMKNSFSIKIQQESQIIEKYKRDIEILNMQLNSILNRILISNRSVNVQKRDMENLNSRLKNIKSNDSLLPQLNLRKQSHINSSNIFFRVPPPIKNNENNQPRHPVSEPLIHNDSRYFHRYNRIPFSYNSNENNDNYKNDYSEDINDDDDGNNKNDISNNTNNNMNDISNNTYGINNNSCDNTYANFSFDSDNNSNNFYNNTHDNHNNAHDDIYCNSNNASKNYTYNNTCSETHHNPNDNIENNSNNTYNNTCNDTHHNHNDTSENNSNNIYNNTSNDAYYNSNDNSANNIHNNTCNDTSGNNLNDIYNNTFNDTHHNPNDPSENNSDNIYNNTCNDTYFNSNDANDNDSNSIYNSNNIEKINLYFYSRKNKAQNTHNIKQTEEMKKIDINIPDAQPELDEADNFLNEIDEIISDNFDEKNSSDDDNQ